RDIVVHTSGSADGLQLCLELLAPDGTVLDLSWYGDAEVTLRLGGAFHSRRLAVRASQVGAVSVARRGRRSTGDRLRLAHDQLRDPAFAALVSGTSPFEELPGVLAGLADGTLPALCHTITYDEGGQACSA
ncbi:MAG TPA: dehydrogenase, partial [Ornithinibacter sp.]|nr:dehydrogenase [Ornithinibacter sp.]